LADAIVAEAEASGAEFKKDPRGKLMRSPQFIAVTQRAVLDDPVRDREDYAAVCCAVQNLMLAAHARGLATKWSTGALAESDAAKRWFGLEPKDRIVAYLYLGYAPENVRIPEPARQPAVVEWRE
jgi:nitroreductase